MDISPKSRETLFNLHSFSFPAEAIPLIYGVPLLVSSLIQYNKSVRVIKDNKAVSSLVISGFKMATAKMHKPKG